MTYLLQILYMISQMPRKEAKKELSRLRADGLFPYPFPPECTHKRSYQTTRTDWYGRLFDKLYLRMTTKSGFRAMRCMNRMKKTLHI